MILVTSYYTTDNEDRQKEINTCLIKNINNPSIKNIYLLNDKTYELDFLLTDLSNGRAFI